MPARSPDRADTLAKRGRGRPRKVDGLLTMKEAAERVGFSVFTLYGWTREQCRAGVDERGRERLEPVLPVIEFGSRKRVDPAVLDTLPDRLRRRLPRPAPSFFSQQKREVDDE